MTSKRKHNRPSRVRQRQPLTLGSVVQSARITFLKSLNAFDNSLHRLRESRHGARFRWLISSGQSVSENIDTAVTSLTDGSHDLLVRLRNIWDRRQFVHFLQGLPAVLAASGLILLAVTYRLSQAGLVQEYGSSAVISYKQQDYEAARVYFERAATLDRLSLERQYDLAITLDQLGQTDRALAMMQRLAPTDRSGLGRAHEWLALKIISVDNWQSDETRREILESHLRRAELAAPDSVDVKVLLTNFYLTVQDLAEALPRLKQLAAVEPKYSFDLATVYARTGQREDLIDAARQADRYLVRQLQSSPDDHASRLKLASLRTNFGDIPSSIGLLEDGLQLDPEGPFRTPLAHALTRMYQFESAAGSGETTVLLGYLRQALKYDSEYEPAIHFLLEFHGGLTEDSTAALEDAIVSGELPGIAHFVMGVKARRLDDADRAGWHLERALVLDPDLSRTANNLAWILAFREQPDLDKALTIIDSVIERWPDAAEFRDTRGQVLVRQGRCDEALDDLQFALRQLPLNRQLHVALSEAYTNIGQSTLAARHAARARQLPDDAPRRHASRGQD